MMQSVYKGVVHPWLCDAMGHLTTRNYLAMFDDSGYHMFFQVFRAAPVEEQSGRKDRGWADVRQIIEYKDELRAGEIVEIKAELRKIGTKSVTFFYEMYNVANGSLSATLESTSVYFDLVERKAIPLTDEMKQRASKHLVTE